MAVDLITPLPPGTESFTRLAKQGSRTVVLRELREGTDVAYPLGSPGLVTVQEVIEVDGRRAAVFPYVPGVTLREVLAAIEAAGEEPPLGLVLRVVLSAARALQHVQPPRPHGGVQDGALQLGFDGTVSLLDFGAPRVTRFRAPGRVNFAADVFSLGAVLHAALTDFEGEYISRLGSLPPASTARPDVPAELDALVQRALSESPDARHSGVAEFADELERAAGEHLFSPAQVSDLVLRHFDERRRLLEELTNDDDADLPLGDASVERTQPRIAAPTPSKKELVPWESQPSLDAVAARNPGGPRDSGDGFEAASRLEVPLDDDASDGRTQPRAAMPVEPPAASAGEAGPVPRTDVAPPRATGSKPATRGTGEHASAPAPRMTGQRPAFESLVSAEVGPIPIATAAPRSTGSRAAPRSTGERPALSSVDDAATNPRASAPRPEPEAADEAPTSVHTPRLTGPRPAPSADAAPRVTGSRPAVADEKPRVTGERPAVRTDETDTGRGPAVRGTGSRDALRGPRLTGERPAVSPDAESPPRAARGTGSRDAVRGPRMTGERPVLSPEPPTADNAIADAETGVRAPRLTGERRALASEPPTANNAIADAETGVRAPRLTGEQAAVRGTGAREAVRAPRLTGERPAVDGAPIADAETGVRAPRLTGQRAALPRAKEEAETNLTPLGDSHDEGATNPRASVPTADITDGETNPRASAPPVLAAITDSETNPRASAPRKTGARPAITDASSAPPIDTNEPTRVRAIPSAAQTDETEQDEADPTNPRHKYPLARTATSAERLWARGQERVETPPHGSPAVSEPALGEVDEVFNEPTAVRERPQRQAPEQTAETAQRLDAVSSQSMDPATSQRVPQRSSLGLSVLILVLLLVVVGIAFAVLRKVQQANELEPLPPELLVGEETLDAGGDEPEPDGGDDELGALTAIAAPVDAGPEEDADAGEEELLDGGDDEEPGDGGEEEEDEIDGGVVDAGTLDAGAAPAPAVKKTTKKKTKRRRRR